MKKSKTKKLSSTTSIVHCVSLFSQSKGTIGWSFGDTVKAPKASSQTTETFELNPLYKSIFDDLSTRYQIPNSSIRPNDSSLLPNDPFQNLRRLFANRSTTFADDFTRTLRDHLSKAINIEQGDNETNNSNSLSVKVVKLRI